MYMYMYNVMYLDNVPVCNCGEVAQLLTVRREDSVNKGTSYVIIIVCIHV